MKHLIQNLMVLFLFLFVTSFSCFHAFGQSACNPNNISTKPAAPVNPQDPSHINKFNWLQNPNYPYNVSCYPNGFTTNPFFNSSSNTLPLFYSKDYKPEDGWEMIVYDLGYDNNGTPNVVRTDNGYMILYNKYTAILRIFLKTCRGTDYQGMKIQLTFPATNNFQTNLFDFAGELKALTSPARPGDAFATAMQEYTNSTDAWYYADFKMNYDPCNCFFNDNSRVQVFSRLISNAKITLNGTITGTLASITNNSGSVNADGTFWKDVGTVGGKLTKVHNSIDGLTTTYTNLYNTIGNGTLKNAMTSFSTEIKALTFLKAGLKALPFVGQAMTFVSDLFAGGSSGSGGPIQLMPLSVNETVSLSGSITAESKYHDFSFGLPGSTTAALDSKTYPYYNETMGVFTFVDQPTMYYEDVITTKSYQETYNYNTYDIYPYDDRRATYEFTTRNYVMNGASLRYAINPAAGLDLQDAQFIVVSEYDKQTIKRNKYEGAGKCYKIDPVTGEALGQGLDVAGTVNSTTNLFQNASIPYDLNSCFPNNFYFSYPYLVKLKQSTNQFHSYCAGCVFQYPVSNKSPYFTDSIVPTEKCTSPVIPYSYDYVKNMKKPYDEFLKPLVKTFSLKVILNFKRRDGAGQNVLHVMTYPITLLPKPTTPALSGASLASYTGTCSSVPNLFRPATAAELQSICASTTYRSNRYIAGRRAATAKTSDVRTSVIESATASVTIYPNPANNYAAIAAAKGNISEIRVIDGNGKQQSIIKCLAATANIQTANLSSGMYIVEVHMVDGSVSREKLIVQHNN